MGHALATQTVKPRFVLRPIPGAVRVTTATPTPCPICGKRATDFTLRGDVSRCDECDAEESRWL